MNNLDRNILRQQNPNGTNLFTENATIERRFNGKFIKPQKTCESARRINIAKRELI